MDFKLFNLSTYHFLAGILFIIFGSIFFRIINHPLVRLDRAIFNQNIKELKLVLSKISKDDIDFPLKGRWLTTLGVAIQGGNIEIVEILIQAGASVNFGFNTESGSNPLLIAVTERRGDIIKLLLKNGAMAGIHFYAFAGNISKVEELLLENPQNVNLVTNALTPLHFAVIGGSIECIKLLLQHDANVNKYSLVYETPLILSINNTNIIIVKLLLDAGAKIIVEHQRENAALANAISQNNFQICELLIQRGANISSAKKDSQSPLHVAARLGRVEIAAFLVENGAIVDRLGDNEDETPLCKAIENNHLAMVDLLIHYGANIDISIGSFLPKARSPLSLSLNYTLSNKSKITALLLQYGATNYGFED
jgi:ankyrin repeat protein